MHERRSVASKVKARERYQASSEEMQADDDNGIEEILKRIGPGIEKGMVQTLVIARILICIFPCINMYILPSYCSYDDDPGSKRDAA